MTLSNHWVYISPLLFSIISHLNLDINPIPHRGVTLPHFFEQLPNAL